MQWMLIVAAVGMAACGATTPTTAPTTPVEDALLAETARLAAVLGVRVRGEITEKRYITPQGEATGWYSGGVAYYNRAMVAQGVSLEPEPYRETATNVAGHEVCHTQSRGHDLLHWGCSARIAAPTYPRPGQ